MVVAHAGKQVGELGKFVIVRGEKSLCVRVRLQMLNHGPGDGQAVEGRGAAADFVEQDQAARRRGVQDARGFRHFDHERGTPARKIVRRADTREDAVENRQLGFFRGNKAAHLCHQRDERRLAKIGGFSAHVRPGDEQD